MVSSTIGGIISVHVLSIQCQSLESATTTTSTTTTTTSSSTTTTPTIAAAAIVWMFLPFTLSGRNLRYLGSSFNTAILFNTNLLIY